ncbi:hypothetical protein ACODM8_09610 [Vibrio ostreicida]|uniref:hypothetical protein n=1 Tax=Vibrio ostreicida TaxID=526588 RepID=UPI003B5B03A6
MSITKENKYLFLPFQILTTNYESNTFFDYVVFDDFKATKIAFYILQKAQSKGNYLKNGKDIDIDFNLSDLKKFYGFSSTTNEELKEIIESLIDHKFVLYVNVSNKIVTCTIAKELLNRTKKQNRDVRISLDDIKSDRCHKVMFFRLNARYFNGDARINRSFIFKLFRLKADTKTDRKNRKKDIKNLLVNNGLFKEYQDYHFMIEDSEYSKEVEKTERLQDNVATSETDTNYAHERETEAVHQSTEVVSLVTPESSGFGGFTEYYNIIDKMRVGEK